MLMRKIVRPVERLLDQAAALIAASRTPRYLLTWLGLSLNFVAAVLFADGRFAAAGGFMILAGICDLLDPRVAARQDGASIISAFLDSVLDRYSDLILFLGLLVYYSQVNRFLDAGLVGGAMAGAVMVSYARARAESLIGKCDVGFWERPERITLMILGALTNRMVWALWLLAIGPNITVVHRIVYTWQRTEGVKRAAALESQQSKEKRDVSGEPLLSRTSAGRGG